MKKCSKLKVLALAIISLSLNSCDDIFDKLAVNPNQQDVASFYNTPENIDKGVKGIYSYLTTPRALGCNVTRILVNRGDEESDRVELVGQYCPALTSSLSSVVDSYAMFYTAASQAC